MLAIRLCTTGVDLGCGKVGFLCRIQIRAIFVLVVEPGTGQRVQLMQAMMEPNCLRHKDSFAGQRLDMLMEFILLTASLAENW